MKEKCHLDGTKIMKIQFSVYCILDLLKLYCNAFLVLYNPQAPYNTIEYYFVNSIDAVRFFIDPEVGQIFVRRNLVGESATFYNVSL